MSEQKQDSKKKEATMATLLDEVKKEHEITYNLIAKIKRLGVHTREGRDQLIEAKDQLLGHHKKDVEVLYPELKKTAEADPNFKGILKGFEKEMKEISGFCTDFFNKYSLGGGGIEFFRDFEKLLNVLESRMQEEKTLLMQKR
jgi:uncharacterized protein YdiU (UPF0061 family)